MIDQIQGEIKKIKSDPFLRTQFHLPKVNDLQTFVRTHQKFQTSNPRIEFDPTLADNWGTDGTMLHFSNKTKTKFSQGIFFPKKWPKLCICI